MKKQYINTMTITITITLISFAFFMLSFDCVTASIISLLCAESGNDSMARSTKDIPSSLSISFSRLALNDKWHDKRIIWYNYLIYLLWYKYEFYRHNVAIRAHKSLSARISAASCFNECKWC